MGGGALYGKLIELHGRSGTIVFIIMCLFLMCFEGLLYLVEHYCKVNKFEYLLQKLTREFMIMGLISFGSIIAFQADDFKGDEWYEAFDFAHLTIMSIALAFVVQAILLIWMVNSRSQQFLRYATKPAEQLMDEYDALNRQQGWAHFFFHHGLLMIPYPRLRENIEYKILQVFFIKSFNLPPEFNFALYMNMMLKKYVTSLVEVRPVNWLILSILVALNYARLVALGTTYTPVICDYGGLKYARYAKDDCIEFYLTYIVFCVCMVLLYDLILLVISEFYMQRLLDHVIDAEVVFNAELETGGGGGGGGSPGDNHHLYGMSRTASFQLDSSHQDGDEPIATSSSPQPALTAAVAADVVGEDGIELVVSPEEKASQPMSVSSSQPVQHRGSKRSGSVVYHWLHIRDGKRHNYTRCLNQLAQMEKEAGRALAQRNSIVAPEHQTALMEATGSVTSTLRFGAALQESSRPRTKSTIIKNEELAQHAVQYRRRSRSSSVNQPVDSLGADSVHGSAPISAGAPGAASGPGVAPGAPKSHTPRRKMSVDFFDTLDPLHSLHSETSGSGGLCASLMSCFGCNNGDSYDHHRSSSSDHHDEHEGLWTNVKTVPDFFRALHGTLMYHHGDPPPANKADDANIAAKQTELAKIFLFGHAIPYFHAVELAALLQCVFIALWATNFVLLARESKNVVKWQCALVFPLVFKFILLRQILFFANMLKSVCTLDKDYTIITDALESEKFVTSKLRKSIRSILQRIDLDRSQWTVFLGHQFKGFELVDDRGHNPKQFLSFLHSIQIHLKREAAYRLFDVIDFDKDGFVTWNDVSAIVFPEMSRRRSVTAKRMNMDKATYSRAMVRLSVLQLDPKAREAALQAEGEASGDANGADGADGAAAAVARKGSVVTGSNRKGSVVIPTVSSMLTTSTHDGDEEDEDEGTIVQTNKVSFGMNKQLFASVPDADPEDSKVDDGAALALKSAGTGGIRGTTRASVTFQESEKGDEPRGDRDDGDAEDEDEDEHEDENDDSDTSSDDDDGNEDEEDDDDDDKYVDEGDPAVVGSRRAEEEAVAADVDGGHGDEKNEADYLIQNPVDL